MRSLVTRLLAPLLALALAAPDARATWSIVAVDNRTREVCVASATCLASFDLKDALPVVVPEVGVAAAQSFVDTTGRNRRRIWDGLLAGETPQQILQALAQQDAQHGSRQYGIVALDQPPVTFSGAGAGQARKGVTGTAGDLVYAIQGNLLTSPRVVDAARDALLATEGGLAKRVLAAMEAAAALGGDGRCSCNPFTPTACGVPASFGVSAYTAFLVLARPGDTTNGCSVQGCANGSYFLSLNVVSGPTGPDPIAELRSRYDAWRAPLRFRVDPLTSRLEPGATALVADGRSSTVVKLRLANVDGEMIYPAVTSGVEVTQVDGPPIATIGPAGSHGLNRFGFKLTATDVPGTATYRVVVQQWQNSTTLADLVLRSDPVTGLHVGRDTWPAAAGGRVPFTLNVPEAAGRPFLVLGTASGTEPGTPFGGAVLPLNRDRVLLATLAHSGQTRLPSGVLDATGHAATSLVLMPGLLERWAGRRLDWAALILGEPRRVTNAVGFTVDP